MDIFKNIIFTLFSFSLIINAILFIPQIIKILKQKNSKGFSKTTFVGFCLTQLLAIVYGYLKPDWILVWGYALALAVCGILTILIFAYSKK